jgi:2-polyprenyl-3-methyl-5-hydroxy-6-metoxy-1,4-benzoquinol methylase
MKKVQAFKAELPERLQKFARYDEIEIDNPDQWRTACRNYLNRLDFVLKAVEGSFPKSEGIRVAEVGCAQANAGLKLAEKGYQVHAYDISGDYLEYSKAKYESGAMEWIPGNFLESESNSVYDAVLMGELVEHCAYPERIVQKAAEKLAPGGTLVLTTPNGARWLNSLPTFSRFAAPESRKALEVRQFGPDGEDHLFLFTLAEFKGLAPAGMEIIGSGYIGGSLVLNSTIARLLKSFPVFVFDGLNRVVAKTPLLNRWTCHNLGLVLKKL